MPSKKKNRLKFAERVANLEDELMAMGLRSCDHLNRLVGRLDWKLSQTTKTEWASLSPEEQAHQVELSCRATGSLAKAGAEVIRIRKQRQEGLDELSSEEIEELIREAVYGKHEGLQ